MELETADKSNHKATVLTVTSAKGGTGKTTVSLLTAAQIAKSSRESFERGITKRPLDVVVIDMDIFDGHIGFVTSNPALDSLTANSVTKRIAYSSSFGIHVLTAPKKDDAEHYNDSSLYEEVIESLKTSFDIIILDTSSHSGDVLNKNVAYPLSDGILFVTTLDKKSINGLAEWLPSVDISKVGIVVNQSMAGVGIANKDIADVASGVKHISSIPSDTKACTAAGNMGKLEKLLEHPGIGTAYSKIARYFTK